MIPSSSAYKVGDAVIIHTPDNKRLHMTRAFITELTEWGAHLEVSSSASGTFRASWSEMKPIPKTTASLEARHKGYSENPCMTCGSFTLRRSGTCYTCDTCSNTSGCS